jgi:hypothetical protein
MLRLNDPIVMPGTGETPQDRWLRSLPLYGTNGQLYVEKRGIPLRVANQAGVRFDPDWNGREAVIAPMRDEHGSLCSLHGRYLQKFGKQNKMLTIGRPNGMIWVSGNVETHSIILVEGLFDSLSLAVCGYSSMATLGRWASWLPKFCNGHTVLIAFDATHSGEAETALYKQRLEGATIYRLLPPDRCKDWNSALLKRGRKVVTRCLRDAHRVPSMAATSF